MIDAADRISDFPQRTLDQVQVNRNCRTCYSTLETVLDLGDFELSYFPELPHHVAGPKVPLMLAQCPTCKLVQLRHTVPPEWMYRNYFYRSSMNEMMRAHLLAVAKHSVERVTYDAYDWVLDIGANDGTLIRSFREVGFAGRFAAVEPAGNLQTDLQKYGRPDMRVFDFFPTKRLQGLRFKIITSIAMFYDVADPNAFVHAVRELLHPDGIWVLELSYLADMVQRNAFDSICHEHLEYYSLEALSWVLNAHGLQVADVELNEVNGASMLVTVTHKGKLKSTGADERIRQVLQRDREITSRTWKGFERRIQQVRSCVSEAVRMTNELGGTVDLYGASTKGNTLLQYCGIDNTQIRWALERDSTKWNHYTVGTGIRIRNEASGREDPANFWLCPIWHFRKAIIRRERNFLDAGGDILFPLPVPEFVTYHPHGIKEFDHAASEEQTEGLRDDRQASAAEGEGSSE